MQLVQIGLVLLAHASAMVFSPGLDSHQPILLQ